ncbi:MAG: response regulator [Pseudomonadota bacterium]
MDEPKTILVVEDNDFVRMQIVRFLDDAGYQTLESSRGDEAVDMTSENKSIAMAIVDVRMEPVDGFDYIRTIHGRNIEIPVILVTGDDNPDLLDQSNKLGVDAVLMKPVEKDRLIKTVERTFMVYDRKANS